MDVLGGHSRGLRKDPGSFGKRIGVLSRAKAIEIILFHYPEYHSSHDKLRRVVKEAWEAVGANEVFGLVREMPARCQAVTDAQGGYTKY